IDQARAMVAEIPNGDGPLVIRRDEWAPGLIGLIAGRLSDELGRPAAVVTSAGDELRGSVRAPADFHVAAALDACAGLLTKRGGHAGAGGFSLQADGWDGFRTAWTALSRPFPPAVVAMMPRGQGIVVDLVLPSRHLTWGI